ncbi:MAG: hypothetical protein K8T25_19315 [Planctomycetia bacterium]|nr:hypothetical protein [Planctomycetia bacterium]
MTEGSNPSADSGEQPIAVVPLSTPDNVPVVVAQLASKRLPHVPRLSIQFLLAWTAVTAVLLGWMQSTNDLRYSAYVPIPIMLLTVGFLAAAGWQICGTALIVWHLVRRTLWPLEPGEWLSIVQANLLVWWFVTVVLRSGFYPGYGPNPLSVVVDVAVPCTLVGGLLLAAIAFRRRRILFVAFAAASLIVAWFSTYLAIYFSSFSSESWQGSLVGWVTELGVPAELSLLLLFAALAVRRRAVWCAVFIESQIIVSVTTESHHFDIVRPVWHCLLLVGLVIAGVIVDRRQREQRHWLHWSALLTAGVSLILLLGLAVVRFIV